MSYVLVLTGIYRFFYDLTGTYGKKYSRTVARTVHNEHHTSYITPELNFPITCALSNHADHASIDEIVLGQGQGQGQGHGRGQGQART